MKLRFLTVLALLSILISVLSGCANVTYTINLKNDGLMDVKYTVLFNEKDKSYAETERFNILKQKFMDLGYEIEGINDKGLNGFVIKKENIFYEENDFVTDEVYNVDILDDILKGLTFNHYFLENSYKINSNIDLTSLINRSEIQLNENIITDEEIKKSLSELNLKLEIILNNGVITNTNSTLVSEDKKTAQWVLIPGDKNKISLEAKTGLNKAAISTYIILSIVLILSIILIIILIRMYKKKNK